MKRILTILLMGTASISLGACGSAQNAASEEITTEAAEESTEAKEGDDKDTTDTMEREISDLSSFRPGQALTSDDLDVLTTDKGALLSRTLAQSEFNQIINQFMSSSYVTDTAYKLAADGLVWNGGSRWDCSAAVLYLMNYYLLPYDEAYQSAEEADPSADPSSWTAAALDSVGVKASAAYSEDRDTGPLFSVSQAMSWGNPVYTYQTINQINENDPGDLQYGDLLFYGTADESDFKVSHVAVYLGQYYLDSGDTGYYQLENDGGEHENTKEGRADGVKISPFRAGEELVHVARIM